MQFFRFRPERPSLWFQFRHSSNDHSKEMLGLARFFPAGSNTFQKFFLGNCVVGFDVVCPDARACSNELVDNSICHSVLRNCFCEIDNCFAESRRPFFQVINALCFRVFAHNRCNVTIPKRFGGIALRPFGLRYSFVIRHSSFVIPPHALKKKTPVSAAFITNIASNACTTEAVVA
jgi:hypothetical protein